MMKNILVLLFSIPFFVFGQTKKDNTLIGAPIPYNTIKAIMFQNGFTLENIDTTFLTTTSKEVRGKSISMKFMFVRSDSNTVITALFRPTLSITMGGIITAPSDFERIEYRGMKGSFYRDAWEELDRIGKLLSPHLRYTRQ